MPRKPALHFAMRAILLDRPEFAAPADFIADEINKRKLWKRPSDGAPVEGWQVELRASTASGRGWFVKSNGSVQLMAKGEAGL